MQELRAFLVDAFTNEPYGGNPAGIVPDGSDLNEGQMQSIASELGASETAFIRSTDAADVRIRYFTPTNEVDLCGHATIASLVTLSELERFEAGGHQIETNVGVLDTTVTEDSVAWMTQATPDVTAIDLSYDRISSILGVELAALEDIGKDLPIARASTGLPFIVVPLAFLENLGGANPDFDAVESVAEEFDAEGIYAFTFDTIAAESTLHGRAFVPGSGVPEDPVTGTASGATGAYLQAFEAFEDLPEEMRFEQGHFVDRPGTVRVKVGADVEVGGPATVTLDGKIAVPPAKDEEILDV